MDIITTEVLVECKLPGRVCPEETTVQPHHQNAGVLLNIIVSTLIRPAPRINRASSTTGLWG